MGQPRSLNGIIRTFEARTSEIGKIVFVETRLGEPIVDEQNDFTLFDIRSKTHKVCLFLNLKDLFKNKKFIEFYSQIPKHKIAVKQNDHEIQNKVINNNIFEKN